MIETGFLGSTEMAARLAEALYVAFLGALILNIIQRRHQARAGRKRFATLYIALGLFAALLLSQGIVEFGGADWMLLPGLALIVGLLYVYRRHTFPFRLRSPRDGRKLTWDEVLFDDNHGDDRQDENPPNDTPAVMDDTDQES
jgi:hypothetical protein